MGNKDRHSLTLWFYQVQGQEAQVPHWSGERQELVILVFAPQFLRTIQCKLCHSFKLFLGKSILIPHEVLNVLNDISVFHFAKTNGDINT